MKKIMVANRGEIALRIMRTLKKMGIKTVAVYSEPDRQAMHVRFADEAVCLGEAASTKSYLNMDKIIDFAKKLGVDGIHPGYGFLSENAVFAQKVEDAGITFIGPTPEAITIMGSKLAAKDAVKAYNIPMVPGVDHAIDDISEAKKVAQEIGFPILIKASAGGGGKGMRIVENVEEFEEQMQRAISEAMSAFGDGSVFIEKYVSSPRHIEVQVLGDKHGNIVHLFERECSIQRRHQKVIEEAPSGILDEIKRKAIGEAAVKVAKSCNYVGAGTVEFLLDEKLNFYFLEMNTRLQVEHPVTEMITGLDLVEQQVKIARGEALSFKQEDLKINGHAVELRVYAEDPLNEFLPSIGKITRYVRPEGEGIRLDDAYEEGMEIPIYYDPMISKLVAYGKNRIEAIEKMKEAISKYEIEGFASTLPFGIFVMNHPDFISAHFDTHFVKDNFSKEQAVEWQKSKAYKAAVIGLANWLSEKDRLHVPVISNKSWKKR
jgi:acetyl-CoA carboxylase biotin carboxylase subunit